MMKWLIIALLFFVGSGFLIVFWESLPTSLVDFLVTIQDLIIVGLAVGGIAILIRVAWKRLKKRSQQAPMRTNKLPARASWGRRDLVRICIVSGFIGLAFAAGSTVGLLTVGTLCLLVAILLVVPLIPGLIEALANEPNSNRQEPVIPSGASVLDIARIRANVPPYKANTYALFTFVKPGRVKAIIRGQRFRRFIMRFEGMKFLGDTSLEFRKTDPAYKKDPRFHTLLEPSRREYWDVVPTPPQEDDSHPIPLTARKDKLDPLWWWSRYVYDITGAVFTGIPPFQTVEVYDLEQFMKVIDDRTGHEGSFVFVRMKDFSDHVRAAEFQFFVQIPGAETQDQVKVRLQFALTMMVINPYRAYYDTDNRWAQRLITAVVQEASTQVRGLGYQQVIATDASENDAVRNVLLEPIRSLNLKRSGKNPRDAKHGLSDIGLYIKEVELLDADVVDDKLAAALADVARAKADKLARITRGEGEAQAVSLVAQAAQRHGHYGELALQVEGNVRLADAATTDKGGSVILNVGGNDKVIDPKTEFLRQSITTHGGTQ